MRGETCGIYRTIGQNQPPWGEKLKQGWQPSFERKKKKTEKRRCHQRLNISSFFFVFIKTGQFSSHTFIESWFFSHVANQKSLPYVKTMTAVINLSVGCLTIAIWCHFLFSFFFLKWLSLPDTCKNRFTRRKKRVGIVLVSFDKKQSILPFIFVCFALVTRMSDVRCVRMFTLYPVETGMWNKQKQWISSAVRSWHLM